MNRLTLNNVTIEYPAEMKVTISADSVRLDHPAQAHVPAASESVPAQQQMNQYARAIDQAHKQLWDFPGASFEAKPQPAPKPKPVPTPEPEIAPVGRPRKGALAANWQKRVLTFLKKRNGRAYAISITTTILGTQATYAARAQLRRGLLAMVASGELKVLGKNSGGHPLYALPWVQEDPPLWPPPIVNGEAVLPSEETEAPSA